MSIGGRTPATESAQARVLRRLYLRLMFRGRLKHRAKRGLTDPRMAFAGSLLMFGLLGLMAFGMRKYSLLGFGTMLHSLTFLLTAMNLASTSGSLLFSPEEADALLHRPVEPRALLRAKMWVLLLVSLSLALALNACGFYVGVLRSDGGWGFAPAHLAAVVLEVLFCASLVVVAYNLCLRWFGRERLDNLMTTVQVAVAVAVMAGAQIVPRILPQFDARAFAHPPIWLAALPPTWFGALDEVLTHGPQSVVLVALAAFGVTLTLLMVWLGVSCLAETYAQGLATLNEAAPECAGRGDRGRWGDVLVHLPVMRWWLRDPVERASFRLTLANVTRARGVKLRLYPTLAQMVIYPVVLLFSSSGPASAFMAPFTIAMGGAFIAVLPATVLEVLRIAEDHMATEVFHFAPMPHPAALFHGARKAVLALLCGPGFLAVALVELAWLRSPALLLLLLPGVILIPLSSLVPAVGRAFVPFGQPVEVQSANALRTVLMLASMAVGFGLAGIAAVAWKTGWYVWFLVGEAALVALLTWVCREWLVRQSLPAAE